MHRGGFGAVYEIEVLEGNGAQAFLFGERGRFAPQGVAGGDPAALNVFSYEQEDGWHHPPLASKMRGITLTQGQSVKLETPGGGGYGPVADRDPARVAKDVASGLTSAQQAVNTYGNEWKEYDT
jgi:N-methylhydantoinase B